MSKTLIFSGEDAVRMALSGLVPAADAELPALTWRDSDGRVFLSPKKALSPALGKELSAVGVELSKTTGPADKRAISCWAEAITARRAAEPEALAVPVLFHAPPGKSLLTLASEMLRLGCDRQSYRVLADGSTLLHVTAPPYYTLTQAIDHVDGLRAFVESRPSVWLEIGWSHPLAHLVRPSGQLVLVGSQDAWQYIEDAPFTDLYDLVDLTLPHGPSAVGACKSAPQRLQVSLELRFGGRRAPASLWVLRRKPKEQVESLVASLPEDVLSRLSFAAGVVAGEEIVVLRARPSQKGPPDLTLDAEAYAQVSGLPNLFAPVDAAIEPPIRRDRLRTLLCPDPEALTWLRPDTDTHTHGFVPELLAEKELLPLDEWVDYIVHGDAGQLEPWVRSAVFAFGDFESAADDWVRRDQPAVEREAEPGPEAPSRKKKSKEKAKAPVVVVTEEVYEPEPVVSAAVGATLASAEPSELERVLASTEERYLHLDAPADAPERQVLWREMAELQSGLGRVREAGMCFSRAVWEQRGEAARAVARAWTTQVRKQLLGGGRAVPGRSVGGPEHSGQQLDAEAALLALTSPSRDEVRALAALLLERGFSGTRRGNEAAIQRWLERFDNGLDLRSRWLARWALSGLQGGDRLGLARARDRLLDDLGHGVSVERDLPVFLRFVGGGVDRDAGATSQLTGALEELLVRYHKTKRARTTVEAPEAKTGAYVHLLFAYGLARLGQVERARALAAPTAAALDLTDPVHGFLHRAYSARLEQALAGTPPGAALPPAIAGELNTLDKKTLQRFKVDRLRESSSVLEPQEHLDPFRDFPLGDGDPRGPELGALRGMTDESERTKAVERIFLRALDSATPVDEKANLLDGVMDFFPLIPESQVAAYLSRLARSVDDVPGPRRAELLEEAFGLAAQIGQAGNGQIGGDLFERLRQTFAAFDDEETGRAARTLRRTLVTLRRTGRRDEAASIIALVTKRSQPRGAAALVGRLHLAASLAYLGHLDEVRKILDEGRARLASLNPKDSSQSERLNLSRALAAAYGQLPRAEALELLGGLADQLKLITDFYNTNTHFCLSVVAFMEALITAIASDDLALGAEGRLFLDEDEYLVRRRVHRDLEDLGHG